MTKIAIPSMSDNGLNADVCAHFGSCEYFTILNVNDGVIAEISAVSNASPDGVHNCAAPAALLEAEGVDAVLVSGIGGRPLVSLTEKKIKVFAGAVGKVSDAIVDYNSGLLQELSTRGTCNCSHH